MHELGNSARARLAQAGWASHVAAAAGLAFAGLALADQLTLGWTERDVAAHYGRFGLHPDPSILTVALAIVGLFFSASMACVALQQRRGRRVLAALSASGIALAWAAFAGVATFAQEYDGQVFGPCWRVLPWLLPITAACAAATSLTLSRKRDI